MIITRRRSSRGLRDRCGRVHGGDAAAGSARGLTCGARPQRFGKRVRHLGPLYRETGCAASRIVGQANDRVLSQHRRLAVLEDASPLPVPPFPRTGGLSAVDISLSETPRLAESDMRLHRLQPEDGLQSRASPAATGATPGRAAGLEPDRRRRGRGGGNRRQLLAGDAGPGGDRPLALVPQSGHFGSEFFKRRR